MLRVPQLHREGRKNGGPLSEDFWEAALFLFPQAAAEPQAHFYRGPLDIYPQLGRSLSLPPLSTSTP